MRTIKYILIFLVFLLSACKTTKQTIKNETTTTESIQLDILEEKTEKKQEETKQLVADQREVDEKINEKTTVIKFSNPNEKGEQHILEIAVKEQNKHSTIAALKTTENEEKKVIEINENSIVSTIAESDFKSETDSKIKEKARQPAWLYGVLIAGCLLVFYLIRKKW